MHINWQIVTVYVKVKKYRKDLLIFYGTSVSNWDLLKLDFIYATTTLVPCLFILNSCPASMHE